MNPSPDGGSERAARHDVCNGDADGLCAALQWQLHEPGTATLVTGLKHDIDLLERVQAGAGDRVNVFDVSMRRNRAALLRLLEAGVWVRYFDHHASGVIPLHAHLEAHIDLASDVCTSLLVDRALGGAQRRWALVGAYGDNLVAVADDLARASGLNDAQREQLARLGVALNYNAYGDDVSDVHIAPQRLFGIMRRYGDPLQMVAHEAVVGELDALRNADLQRALMVPPVWLSPVGTVYRLPDAPWSRRVIGGFANELANREPALAHAVVKDIRDGSHCNVSVRAPLLRPSGADGLCRRYGGGGRARAAGIDQLASTAVDSFIADFAAMNWVTLDNAG